MGGTIAEVVHLSLELELKKSKKWNDLKLYSWSDGFLWNISYDSIIQKEQIEKENEE